MSSYKTKKYSTRDFLLPRIFFRDLQGSGKKRLAQISMEYLTIMGFVVAAFVPLTLIFYAYTQGSAEEIASEQLSKIAKEVVDAAEAVYYQGKPSQVTLEVYMPSQLRGVWFEKKSLILQYQTQEGMGEIIETSAVNISGSMPMSKGTYSITIKAVDDYVNISYR